MHILLFSIHNERKAIARMPKALKMAGFEVAVVCPSQSFLANSAYIDKKYIFSNVKSADQILLPLKSALEDWQPVMIVPGDEMAVSFLHYLVHQSKSSVLLSDAALKCLTTSLSDFDSLAATVYKNKTLQVVRALGLSAPAGNLVTTTADALDFAQQYGYPIVLKKDFSWGGEGVRVCTDEFELKSALPVFLPPRSSTFKSFLRHYFKWDWYPSHTALEVQQFIPGRPANVCLVALRGKVLAGFAVIPEHTASNTGPSSVVRLTNHPEMLETATKLVEKFSYSGFIGFDFLLEANTGKSYFLECNPRPTPSSHLGTKVGIDLCQALLAGFKGESLTPLTTVKQDAIVALFPDEWVRDSNSRYLTDAYHDVPWDEPHLVSAHIEFVSR